MLTRRRGRRRPLPEGRGEDPGHRQHLESAALEGFRSALGTHHPPNRPLAALGLAKPSRAVAAAGKASLRQRG